MGQGDWLSAASDALFLAIGSLALVRGARSPLAPPLALLCVAFFAYETAEVVRQFAHDATWDWLHRAAAALVGPPTLWLVATFARMRRRLAVPLWLASSYFVVLASLCVIAVIMPELRRLPESDVWALAMLGGMAPTFGAIPIVLGYHAWRADAGERARTQLFGLALLLGVGGVTSQLFAIAGAQAPRVAAVGIVVSVLLLGALVLRARVTEETRGLVIVSAIALASVATLGHVLLLEWLGDRAPFVVLGATLLTMALLAALRPIQIFVTEQRARTLHLATLGRLSAQTAHDLKNPLSAIKGAAQWLGEDSRGGAHSDAHRELVALIIEQTDRLSRVVDGYQRLGLLEAMRAPIDLGALIEEVANAERAAAQEEAVTIRARVHPGTPAALLLDRDLVQGALTSLVRNARDALGATKRSGRIDLVVEPREREISLRVEDDGPGMDARTSERAFDEFFTTKASGSGLGLALVSRVARAHGGRASLDSRPGGGTRVEMTLPMEGEESSSGA